MKVSNLIKRLTKDKQKQMILNKMIDNNPRTRITWNEVNSIIGKRKVQVIKHIDTDMFN